MAGGGPCNATMLVALQGYRDAFLAQVQASASADASLNHGYALTGCMQVSCTILTYQSLACISL